MAGDGYAVQTLGLGWGTHQMVLVARRPGFLPCVDEEALWQALKKDITTPLLRGWVPWLLSRLRAEDLLKDCTCYGCNAGILLADSAAIDNLVTGGIDRRLLFIA